MKWALVVYFMTATGWQSAEVLGKDKIGWSSVACESYQQCFFELDSKNGALTRGPTLK